MTRLILGTAQFGHGYGITNNSAMLDDNTVADILLVATNGGVETFDTADAYGDAQSRIGRLKPANAPARYISKFALDREPTAAALYGDAMVRLRVGTLEGLLAHRVADLHDERFSVALAVIRAAHRDGLIQRFGVSVYDQEDLELALATIPDLNLIQIPGSLIDRRLLDSPLVTELRSSGVEVHVRSAFLQGLLLAAPSRLPSKFDALRPVLEDLDTASAALGASRLSVLLGYIASHDNAGAVVVGATTRAELQAILAAWSNPSAKIPGVDPDGLSLDLLDPRRW